MSKITARNTEFHIQKIGNGETRVVLLHGLVWDNMSSWYFSIAPHLSKHGEILLYDMRGHGKSECSESGYRLEDFVEDLDAILETTGFNDRPVHLVGNSFGGLVAIAYALTYPDKVESLILIDALSDDESMQSIVESVKLKGNERDREITNLFRKWVGRHEDPANTKLAAAARELVEETAFLQEFPASCFVNDEKLSTLKIPVLAMFGGESNLLTRGKQLAKILKNCELVVFEGGSHVILWEYSQLIYEHTISWLIKLDSLKESVNEPHPAP